MKLFSLHSSLPKRNILFLALALILISFLTAWFFQSKPSIEHQQKLLQEYVLMHQRDAQQMLADTALIRRLATHTETLKEFESIKNKSYGLFVFSETVFDNQQLLFWNNQNIIPPQADYSLPDGIHFQRLLNGYYIIQKRKLTYPDIPNPLSCYVLLPVLNKYYLETENSLTGFAHNKEAVKKITLADSPTDFPIKSIYGKELFYITKAPYSNENYTDPVTFILRFCALTLLLTYFHLLVLTIAKTRGSIKGLVVLITGLLLVRLLLYLFPAVFSLRQLSLFDPLIFASNFINRSLGDLLLNAVFICWIVLFTWENLGPLRRPPHFLKGIGLLIAGVAAIFVLILLTFQLATVVHDLVVNSKISFSVINVFSLDIYTVFGFIVLALLALTYYYLSRLLFRFILLIFPNLLQLYFAVALVGLVFLTVRNADSVVLFQLPVLAWLLVYTLLLSQEHLTINRLRITLSGILFWIFVFSISLAVLIIQGNHQTEWRERRGIADKYEQLNDPSKEQTLRIALTYLDNRFLHNNFFRFYRQSDNRFIRDSIINANSIGYNNSYTTNLYVFDAQNYPVNNEDNRSYDELTNILDVQSKPTGSPDLFYYETSYDQFVYITKRDIYDSTKLLGRLFIVAAPKQFETADALYPNLFRQGNKNDIENSPLYSYAFYKNGSLLNHSSKYPFVTRLDSAMIPTGETSKVENGEYDELWYKAGNQKIVVVAKKKDSFIEGITLFSYLFCVFLFMVGILRVVSYLVQLAGNRRSVDFISRLNIRTQIHGTVIFISVLSFLIIGVATISFFIVRYNRNNTDRLSKTANGTVAEIEKRMLHTNYVINNNSVNFSDSAAIATLHTAIQEIAAAHGVIVNLYDLWGTLQVTSDEAIYQKGVLSTKMHPQAFYYLNTLHQVQCVQDETVNKLNYLSIYIAVRNERGDTYAYLNIPSFTSQLEVKQEISNFLVTIINLNAFVFLLAGVAALFITNRITGSFSVIGNKMKEITMGKAAEEIVWNKKDEIGELVKQYNKMVHQLEQSAEALAKSEREGAWREMARQVAHEIKNPLTPMKLSIQYLQNAIQHNRPNVQQLTTNVANTLIEQIDHLSKIAGDFSQFANIGNKKAEQMDLHAVLSSLVDLYAANPVMNLTWNKLDEPLLMYTDKTHMNRLFTNLLSNAVDAGAEKENPEIIINEKKEGDFVILSLSDNGEGIPGAMQSKIFTPNFTTKSSGTGLGLAMCKSIVEQAGGNIWFITKEGEGTTFYIKLPLAD